MKRLTWRARVVASLGALAIVVAAAAVAGQSQNTQKWPPQFPREGATKLFENEHVIIWEQIGRPKDTVMHKHIRDIVTVQLDAGGGIGVTNAPGVAVGAPSLTQTIYNNAPTTVFYSKAGVGPHAELMKDPKNPGRSIFIEIKGSEPKDCREWSTAC